MLTHAQALQYNCQVWLTHCVGEQNATSMPGDAHARHRVRLTPTRRHVRGYHSTFMHVLGFGSRRRVAMAAQPRQRVRLTPTRRHVRGYPSILKHVLGFGSRRILHPGCMCVVAAPPPLYTRRSCMAALCWLPRSVSAKSSSVVVRCWT